MKKLIVITVLLGMMTSVFAEHFQVTVTNQEGEKVGTRIYNGLSNHLSLKNIFICTGDCEGELAKAVNMKPGQLHKEFEESVRKENPKHISGTIKSNDMGGLKYSKHNEFLSASGRTYLINELLLQYEQLALGEKSKLKYKMFVKEDVDVLCELRTDGKKYIIDIYTGEDAQRIMDSQEE